MNEEKQEEAVAGDGNTADITCEVTPDDRLGDNRNVPLSSNSGGAGWAAGILTNIRVGIRLAFLRRVAATDLAATPGAFTALALFDLFLHLALSFARVGPAGHFNFQYFPYAVTHIPLMLFAGLWIGRLARRNDLALALSTACLATGIPIDLLAELFNALPENGWLNSESYFFGFDHFHPFFFWWAVATIAAVLRMTGMPRLRRFGALAVFTLTLLIPLWSIPRVELWSGSDDDSTSGSMTDPGSEEVIYRQPVLLEDALERLKPGRKGVEDLYFIGFAGDGSQDVFKKELEVIGGLVRNRFDAAGRSLLLVNNTDTLLKYPIATATALELALKRVGQVMDRDEDILLLYLTSHGSEDHHISAELRPLNLTDIDPDMLRQMLDESGIRWRIVVVSACYSGSYIDSLKDDGTLIMTASDASSSSFGCSNDSDFTWFGKALFDEELRRTYSFTTAFSRASQSIAGREAKEGEEPSNPQIFVGKDIAPRLKRLEERLERMEHKQFRITTGERG